MEEQVVPLPTKGMHLLLGPSGAGKTTIGEAVAFALGYSNFSATDLQSWDWLSKEPLRDTLEVETAKGTLRVTRGKAASILMPGEEKPRTSAKAVKEGLAQALGIDPELYLAPLTYRPQKTPGLFLSMRDGEKKAFLTQLLGLEKFEQAAERSVKGITSLAEEVDRAQVKHQTLVNSTPPAPEPPRFHDLAQYQAAVVAAEEEAEGLGSTLEATKKLDLHLTEQQAAKVKAAQDEWRPKLVAAKAAFESVPQVDTTAHLTALEAVRFAMAGHIAKNRGEVTVLEKELETTIQFQNAFAALVAKKAGAQSRLLQAEADHDQISSDVCPTCVRSWPTDPTKVSALARCEAVIAEQKKILSDAEGAERQAPVFAAAIADLRSRLRDLKSVDPVPTSLLEEERRLVGLVASAKSERDAQVANLRAEFHKLKGEAEAAVSAIAAMTPEEEQIRRTLGDLNSAFSQAGHKVSSAKQTLLAAQRENTLSKSHYDQAATTYNNHADAVLKAAVAINAAEAALNQERDFLAMVRGFLSYIFDETLARIADATNARLALIPNVSGLTIRFASERETGTGKLRQEITVVCEKNGHVIPLKAGTSGGMETAVELAVDLSLADVIADRTGVYPGWLILDEAFEGLDTACKAACFDMLKDISRDRAVLVVDHTNEFQELFDSKIRVDFDGERSTIVLQ